MPRHQICFVCDYNAIRSPMAAALLQRKKQGADVFISSAGLDTRPINPFAVAVMKEIGVDLAAHEPLPWRDPDAARFDQVIFLGDQLPAHLSFARHWDIRLPNIEGNRDQILDGYRRLRDDLNDRLESFF